MNHVYYVYVVSTANPEPSSLDSSWSWSSSSYAKSHISWMANDGKIIGAVVGHPVFNNGKVRLIFFMKTCS